MLFRSGADLVRGGSRKPHFVDIIESVKANWKAVNMIGGPVLAIALFVWPLIHPFREEATVSVPPVKAVADRKRAPEFALKDADGKIVHLEEYKGKVVLLDFFATWCGPCKKEIPWFMEMERANKDKGFSVLGVSMDDEGWEVVKPFLAGLGVNYRVVIGNDADRKSTRLNSSH